MYCLGCCTLNPILRSNFRLVVKSLRKNFTGRCTAWVVVPVNPILSSDFNRYVYSGVLPALWRLLLSFWKMPLVYFFFREHLCCFLFLFKFLKTNFRVKDVKMTCASKMLKDFIAPYTATCVQRLVDGGFLFELGSKIFF